MPPKSAPLSEDQALLHEVEQHCLACLREAFVELMSAGVTEDTLRANPDHLYQVAFPEVGDVAVPPIVRDQVKASLECFSDASAYTKQRLYAIVDVGFVSEPFLHLWAHKDYLRQRYESFAEDPYYLSWGGADGITWAFVSVRHYRRSS